jgi:hypothetical protein
MTLSLHPARASQKLIKFTRLPIHFTQSLGKIFSECWIKRKFKSSFFQKFDDCWFYFIFQNLFRVAHHNTLPNAWLIQSVALNMKGGAQFASSSMQEILKFQLYIGETIGVEDFHCPLDRSGVVGLPDFIFTLTLTKQDTDLLIQKLKTV